jgi:lipopolysaccharide transport system ATP-binding protein
VTILFVSHDLGLVKRLCHRAILMAKGEVLCEGRPTEVVNRYVGLVHEKEGGSETIEPLIGNFRHGDAASRITSVQVLNSEGIETSTLRSGEVVRVRVQARFDNDIENPIVGMLIRNRLGIEIFGTNTRIENVDLGAFRSGDVLEIDFQFVCMLTRQEYTLTVATQHRDGSSQDWLDDVSQFTVVDDKDKAGVANLKTDISWQVNPIHNEKALTSK